MYGKLMMCATILTLAACHDLLPYEPTNPDGDASTLDAGLDAAPDSRVPDSRVPDSRVPDSRVPDSMAPDSMAPDSMAPDSMAPDSTGGCNEPPTINANAASCSQQCLSSVGDQDCDGIPDSADPKPTICHPLLLVDEFASSPLSSSTWTIAKGGDTAAGFSADVGWSCGKTTVTTDHVKDWGRLTLADPALLDTGLTYMIELKFTLGGAPDIANWRVMIRSGMTSGNQYNCELWMSSQYGAVAPQLHFNINNACGNSGAWGPSQNPISSVNGSSYIMRSWHDGSTGHCEIYDSQWNALQAKANYSGCPWTRPDTFFVQAGDRGVTMDWIRVFAVP